MCICGEFDCTEQSHISRLFPEARPTFEQYKSGLADPGVRTSAKNSVYEFKRNILTVQAVTENGENRQSGGDFWITRLKGVLKENEVSRLKEVTGASRHQLITDSKYQLFISPIDKTYHGNGVYTFEFPNVITYSKHFDINLEVVLERSSEIHEVNRRAMASYHMVGRLMYVGLPNSTVGQNRLKSLTQNDQKWLFFGIFGIFGPFLELFGYFDPKIPQNPIDPGRPLPF